MLSGQRVCVTLEDSRRPQPKSSVCFCFKMSFIHHAIAKKMKEDKEKDKMVRELICLALVMTRDVFRLRNWRRVPSRPCWGASPGTVWPVIRSPSTPPPPQQPTPPPTIGDGRKISGDRSPLKMFLSGEYY